MTTAATTGTPSIAVIPSRIYGTTLIAAPILLLAAAVVFLAFEARYMEGIVGGTISTWGTFALGIGFVGFSRLLEPLVPRAATALLVLSLLGMAGGAMFRGTAIHQGHFGRHTDYPNTVINDGGNAFGLLAYVPWSWMMPVAIVLSGMLVWRTGVAPRWSALALIGGGVLFLTGVPAQIGPIVVTCYVLLTVGLIPVGLAMLAAVDPR